MGSSGRILRRTCFEFNLSIQSWNSRGQSPFQWTSFGIQRACPKWTFFAWKANWRKVWTSYQFQNKGWSLVNRFFLCKLERESIKYILSHHINAMILWHLLFSSYNVVWVILSSVKETLLSWHNPFVGRKRKKV